MDKTQQRKRIIEHRKKLTAVEIEALSKQMMQHLCSTTIYQTAKQVALYLAVNGEADPSSLLTTTSVDKQFYLPVVDNRDGIKMHFAKYQPGAPLAANEFGILEPELTPESVILANELDIVITPLVGFDNNGNRLGMGGGYYDRTFSFKQQANVKPFLMGFAYNFQLSSHLQENPWDVKLDGITTEKYTKNFT